MERQTRVRIAAKGRVVIPASFRDALGWKEGDEVQLRIEENEIRISTLRNRIKDAQDCSWFCQTRPNVICPVDCRKEKDRPAW